jgi:hypothetical protein
VDAPLADVGADAARADVVVVVQVDIEDELALLGLEGLLGEGLVLVRRRGVDGADLHALRNLLDGAARELLRVAEAQVPHVHVVLERVAELAAEEEVGPDAGELAVGVCEER